MDLGLEEFNGDAVAGHVMHVDRIRSAYDSLRPLTREDLLRVVQIDPGRADVLLAGIVILLTFMEGRGIDSVTVSERGLRYGIALREVLRQSASIR
jgi:exopolyphosphatase/guanosine-5'-triphosphate,3'-diphosphate pyrophosphatase